MPIEKSETITNLAKALTEVQKELTHASKDSKGFNYNYSNLEEVINSSRDLLCKNNLAITQLVGEVIDKVASVTTILMHESGEFLQTTSTIPIVKAGSNDAQGLGASITYLRRYAYQAIIGQASEDSDAKGENSTAKKNKNSDELRPNKGITDKQISMLRKNADRLTPAEINKLKYSSMSPTEASGIIDEIIKKIR